MKASRTNTVYLSPLDEKRFGIITARAHVRSLSDLEATLAFSAREGVELLMARCCTSDLHVVNAVQADQFSLTGTLLYYTRDLDLLPEMQSRKDMSIRSAKPSDLDPLRFVAREAFRGFYGHYHADPRLDKEKCDETYVDWATRSLQSREVADEILLAVRNDKILGFGTLKLNGQEEGEGILFAVDPRMQRQGILTSLILESMRWFSSQGAARMLYSTQLSNIAPQQALTKLGFTLGFSYYTFHRWFG